MSDAIHNVPNTEDELLAMPEEAYMNPQQQEFFRARLRSMREQLLEGTEQLRTDLQQSSQAADEVDRASEEENRQLELRIHERQSRLLRKIDEALHRIETGEYGFCEESGHPIGLPRLLVRPTATLSVDAKERMEATEHLFGE